MEIIKTYYQKLTKEDKFILGIALIIGFVNFFYLLTHHVLSPDGLAFSPIYKSNGWEVDLGRPLLLIVDRIRGGLVSPPIILFISLLIQSISIMLLRRIFKIENKILLFLLTIIVILFPTLSESALFIYCLDSYSLALLFSILGIYFIKREKRILAILSIIISLSLYQAYVSVTLTGIIILYIQELLENKNNWKNFLLNGCTAFLGLILYFVLLKTGMFLFGRELASYKGASSFGINTILSLPNSIMNSYIDFISFFFKENIIYNGYYYRNIINYLLFVIFFSILIIKGKSISTQNKIILGILLLLYPIATNIMNLIACDTRINLVTGIAFVMFYVLLINIIKYIKNKHIELITVLLLVFLSFTYLLSNNGTFMAREDSHKNYYYECEKYLNKANILDGFTEDLPWMFSDIIRYESQLINASNGYLAKDNITFDNYDGIDETSIFIDHYFGKKIRIVDQKTYQEIVNTKEYKNMKVNEVKIIQDTVVVKVKEDTPYKED